jgi:hypothetical protein
MSPSRVDDRVQTRLREAKDAGENIHELPSDAGLVAVGSVSDDEQTVVAYIEIQDSKTRQNSATTDLSM